MALWLLSGFLELLRRVNHGFGVLWSCFKRVKCGSWGSRRALEGWVTRVLYRTYFGFVGIKGFGFRLAFWLVALSLSLSIPLQTPKGPCT